LSRSPWGKGKTEYLLSNLRTNPEIFFFYLLLLLLPTQLGKHFWPTFSYVLGTRVDYLSPTLYLTDIIILFITLFYLPKAKIFQRIEKYKKYIFLFFLFTFLSIASSASPLSGIYSQLKLLEFLILFLFISDNYERVKNFIAPAMAMGIIFVSVLAIAQFLNGGSIGGIFYFAGERFFSSSSPNIANAFIAGELVLRPYATFPHPNVLAAYILIGTFFILKELSTRRPVGSFFYFISLGMGSIAIVLTLSRMAIFLYALLLIYTVLGRARINKKLNLKILLFLAPLFVLSREIFIRFQNLFLIDQSVVERLDLTRASMKMFFDHPFTGAGLGNFLHTIPYYYKSDSLFFLQPVHNIFLFAASEVGIVGLGLLTAIFVILFKNASRNNFILSFIVLALSLSDHFFLTLQQGQILFILTAAYILADKSRN